MIAAQRAVTVPAPRVAPSRVGVRAEPAGPRTGCVRGPSMTTHLFKGAQLGAAWLPTPRRPAEAPSPRPPWTFPPSRHRRGPPGGRGEAAAVLLLAVDTVAFVVAMALTGTTGLKTLTVLVLAVALFSGADLYRAPSVPVGARRRPRDRGPRAGRRRRCHGARWSRRRAGGHWPAEDRRSLRGPVPGRPEPRVCRPAHGAPAPPAAAAGAAARRRHRRRVPGGQPARPPRVRPAPGGHARRRPPALPGGAARAHAGPLRRPQPRPGRAGRRRRHRHLRPGAEPSVVDMLRGGRPPVLRDPLRAPGSTSCTPSPGTPRSSGACRWSASAVRPSAPGAGRASASLDVVVAALALVLLSPVLLLCAA